ncbi:hypothetical protein JL722_437 [Aureococcus anophagefferens]|nr:hypothetical protein JL722_437 [Aureococcus anophagefferens]
MAAYYDPTAPETIESGLRFWSRDDAALYAYWARCGEAGALFEQPVALLRLVAYNPSFFLGLARARAARGARYLCPTGHERRRDRVEADAKRDAAAARDDAAYKRLALLHHPDRRGSREAMAAVNAAYAAVEASFAGGGDATGATTRPPRRGPTPRRPTPRRPRATRARRTWDVATARGLDGLAAALEVGARDLLRRARALEASDDAGAVLAAPVDPDGNTVLHLACARDAAWAVSAVVSCAGAAWPTLLGLENARGDAPADVAGPAAAARLAELRAAAAAASRANRRAPTPAAGLALALALGPALRASRFRAAGAAYALVALPRLARSSLVAAVADVALAVAKDGPAFDAAVARSRRVAVLISAPWCRACRAIRPKLKWVSAEYEAKGVAFFEVSQPDVADMASESEFLAADDVKFTPMVQLYEERRRVDCFKAGPSGGYFTVRPKLDGWLDGRDPSGIVAPPRGPSKFELERRAAAEGLRTTAPVHLEYLALLALLVVLSVDVLDVSRIVGAPIA